MVFHWLRWFLPAVIMGLILISNPAWVGAGIVAATFVVCLIVGPPRQLERDREQRYFARILGSRRQARAALVLAVFVGAAGLGYVAVSDVAASIIFGVAVMVSSYVASYAGLTALDFNKGMALEIINDARQLPGIFSMLNSMPNVQAVGIWFRVIFSCLLIAPVIAVGSKSDYYGTSSLSVSVLSISLFLSAMMVSGIVMLSLYLSVLVEKKSAVRGR